MMKTIAVIPYYLVKIGKVVIDYILVSIVLLWFGIYALTHKGNLPYEY